jgi:hypothetical protein
MSEQKKGVHHAIVISYYSISKDEYIPIEDMAHEHLVNVIYKSVTKPDEYLANFRIRDNKSGAFDDATLSVGVSPNFMETIGVVSNTA